MVAEDYRVPVVRIPAGLLMADGVKKQVTLFLPPQSRLEDLFESPDAFLPAREGEIVRLVNRQAVACIEVEDKDDPGSTVEDAGVPEREIGVLVRLREGAGEMSGTLRFIPSDFLRRTVDILNQPQRCLVVHCTGAKCYVAKQHIEHVEESQGG